jgi:hypothetical protein
LSLLSFIYCLLLSSFLKNYRVFGFLAFIFLKSFSSLSLSWLGFVLIEKDVDCEHSF